MEAADIRCRVHLNESLLLLLDSAGSSFGADRTKHLRNAQQLVLEDLVNTASSSTKADTDFLAKTVGDIRTSLRYSGNSLVPTVPLETDVLLLHCTNCLRIILLAYSDDAGHLKQALQHLLLATAAGKL